MVPLPEGYHQSLVRICNSACGPLYCLATSCPRCASVSLSMQPPHGLISSTTRTSTSSSLLVSNPGRPGLQGTPPSKAFTSHVSITILQVQLTNPVGGEKSKRSNLHTYLCFSCEDNRWCSPVLGLLRFFLFFNSSNLDFKSSITASSLAASLVTGGLRKTQLNVGTVGKKIREGCYFQVI
jgi:hypothetical protein